MTTPDIHRLLPQSPDAEKAVISAFALAPDFAGAIYDEKGITPSHFHIPAHQTIFRVIMELYEERAPVSDRSVCQILQDRGQIEQVGGNPYVWECIHFFPTAINAAYDADTVADKHTLREVIRICTQFAADAYEPTGDPQAMVDALECAVLGIRRGDDTELREIDPKDGAMHAIKNLERLYENHGNINGLSTGFSELDKMTDGLQRGEMFIIAARPSMGKTALAMNIAEHIAVDQNKPVAFFSAEMAGTKLHERLMCSRARIDQTQARYGFLAERDFPALTVAATRIGQSKLYIVDAIGARIGAVRAKARRMHRRYGLAAVFVDYLQMLRSKSAQAARNREREISEISQGLKNLAKELDVPVVVLAQLNRNPEGRKGDEKGRPMLSDLRESGSIEQDADTVALLTRPEYYAVTPEEKKEAEGKATLIIAKARNGPTGEVDLTFLKEFTRFENRARDTHQSEFQ